jgi:3-deoxy-D-manno-octulosonic-acid transferase
VVRIVAFPLLVFYFLYRGCRDPKYFRTFAERLGALPLSFKRTAPGCIWLHAVSVGEVISSVRLVEELRARNPQIPVYVSTTTLAGRAVAEQKLRPIADGVFYAPIDYAFAVRRVLRRIRPAVVVVLETEIWPVLYREAKRAQCGLLILNGRISDRTTQRYRSMRWVFRHILSIPDVILVQTERDRIRYVQAGAPAGIVRVGGNLKYDARAPTVEPPRYVVDLIARLRPSSVWIAASTMPGLDSADVDEDDTVLRAFVELAKAHPSLLLILVPRRPERFAIAEEKLRAAGVRYVRRSANRIDPDLSLPGVLLLDSIGELASLFPMAAVVFMGGTLARRGGHNVLEPALCQNPIVVGAHMENFPAIAEDFHANRAWVEIASEAELGAAVGRLLDDPALRAEVGARAVEVARKQSGFAATAAGEILRAQDCALPNWRRSGPATPILWLLSLLWKLGGHLKQRRDVAKSRSLETPVISVGGITMGGSGKTPFVEMLGEEMHKHGRRPAILTRGYRRRSLERSVIVQAGSPASCTLTGDEAQILVRSGCADVGIGADRWSTGRLIEQRFHPGVVLLDDGFQHRRLARQLDIVLIDALNPFPGEAVFPLGFLRESLHALGRADAFVITRAQPNRRYAGIRSRLHDLNPRAPVFTASVEPGCWVNQKTGEQTHEIDGGVAAFCGLANPAAFWQTLSELGIEPLFAWTFGDHHHYRPRELRRLAMQAQSRGVRILVTTEKDAMNLPDNGLEMLGDVDLYWLKIGTVVHEQEQLSKLIAASLRSPINPQ